MASAKKEAATAASAPTEFDFSKFMPEGYSATDLRKVGGFTPIYVPEAVSDNDTPPAAGWLHSLEIFPEVQQGISKETGLPRIYVPVMIRMVATAPTTAWLGKGDEIEPVDIKVDEEFLLPLTGNLRVNRPLLSVIPGGRPLPEYARKHVGELPPLLDEASLFFGIFRLKGQRTVKNGDMWDWDFLLHPKARVREGRFLLASGVKPAGQLPQTSSGVAYDPATGEVKDKVPAQARA